uniref:Uncharacterized protein n=1 Tax=Tanacetum cinerariifolium TaxID=118510 RepID=A0A6L2J1W8_TANCI|nr:hypothetical protein [Tanacetum cinerariifolium]
MVESSSQIPQQQEPIPQQEPNPQQQDQPYEPESPIAFEPTTQVSFHIDNIIFNENNEVSLLYPPQTKDLPHEIQAISDNLDIQVRGQTITQWFPTIGYGEALTAKETPKKSLFPSRWRLLMARIIQCLGGKTGGFNQITNKDVIILCNLANGVNIDYAKLI